MNLSAYEQERLRTIAANQSVLASLGLEPPASKAPAKHEKAPPKRKAPTSSEPVRRKSTRFDADKAAKAPAAENAADIPSWHVGVFRECERAATSAGSGAVWDERKHHQHLARSDGGRCIATTGVAGYGAAIVRREAGCRRWAVRAYRFGVGGFAVGVVRASMKAPFKSIGKSAEAVGAYHSSGVFTSSEHGERSFGPAFAPGDLLEVELRPSASKRGQAAASRTDVVFLLNGEEVGVGASVDERAESLLLACQPYMGGVARLE